MTAGEPTVLPADSRRRFHAEVRHLALELLVARGGGRTLGSRRWLYEPVLYTLERRRDYFPGVFALASGSVGDPSAGRVAAATVEIAWACCAQMLDDMLDRPPEREGHRPAHAVYGYARTTLSIVCAILSLPLSIIRVRSLPLPVRIRWIWTGGLAGLHGLLGVAPSPRSFAAAPYARRAGAVGKPVEWALLAPLVGRVDRAALAPLRRYARLHGVNEKIGNDLVDYCGGSTESPVRGRSPRFSDFLAQRITFPAIVLLQQELDESVRIEVTRHFASRRRGRPLSVEEGVRAFVDHRAFEHCVQAMRQNARAAEAATEELESAWPAARPLAEFLRQWERESVALAERDVRAAVARDDLSATMVAPRGNRRTAACPAPRR